ncbi:MAG: four helix bundle protein [bacterium]|nr:four helix bundle protein [bacterium]
MTQFPKLTPELLYERLLEFAKRCQRLVRRLPKAVYNIEYGSQLIRSSASPGANYIEVIEAISFKDFVHRLKICLKETKESIHWLLLIENANLDSLEFKKEIKELIQEARELIKIFSSSLATVKRNKEIKK